MKNNVSGPSESIYENIKIGEVFEFKRQITREDMDCFARLTGDYNPIHIDSEYAKSKLFKDRIVYGMLSASLFSTLIGMHCPGRGSLYLSQTLNFRSYLIPGDEVIVRGEIFKKYDSIRTIVIKTLIINNDKIIMDGEARVKII